MWKQVVVAIFAIVVAGCSDPCSNTIVSSVDAPGGEHRAVLFQRDCGATTSFTTQVAVLRVGETLSGAGGVFVADTDHDVAQAAEWGGPWAEIVWLSPTRLLVRRDANARVFKAARRMKDLQIEFQSIRRPRSPEPTDG
jgi:hypothetical protein